MRWALAAALASVSTGCGSSSGGPAGDGGSGAVLFSAAERAKIAELSPAELPAPPRDVTNHWAEDDRAARFGQKLFFETRFSGELIEGDNDDPSQHPLGKVGETGKVSCAGCHVPESGFVDTRSHYQTVSLAAEWLLRRTPTLLDVGQAKLITWGGRRDALYNQPFGPIDSEREMNSSRLFVAEQTFRHHKADYEAIFGTLPALDDVDRFPELTAKTTGCRKVAVGEPPDCHGKPGDGAEYDAMAAADPKAALAVDRVVVNLGKALGAYERRLSCGQGRFDAWAHGDEAALSASEQRGLSLFLGKAKCVNCHSGPFFSDQGFHNIGLLPEVVALVIIDSDDHGAAVDMADAIADPLNTKGDFSDGDDGRLPDAVPSGMDAAFRTPPLRCVSTRPSFFHTGQASTLEDVVLHFSRGGLAPFGKSEIAALALTEEEQADLVAFMGALDGPGPEDALLGKPSGE